MKELTEKQKQAFRKLISVLNEKGKRYVSTEVIHSEWFTVKETDTYPYIEINYKFEAYMTVKPREYAEGRQEFVLKLNDLLLREGILTEDNDLFKKEYEVSYFIMEALNVTIKVRSKGFKGYLHIQEDGSPLQEFKKNFMI